MGRGGGSLGQGGRESQQNDKNHRQSSRHIHHPLSAHLPSEGRRKKGSKSEKKKKKKKKEEEEEKTPRAWASVAGETPTIDEEAEGGQDEEGEDDTGDTETEPTPEELLPNSSPEGVQFFLQEDDTERQSPLSTEPAGIPTLPSGPRAGAGSPPVPGPTKSS
ncbi:Anion exchange protein 2, partial [Ophiophagus hannah]